MSTAKPRGRNQSRSDGIIIITKGRNPEMHITPLLVSTQCSRRQLVVTVWIIPQQRHSLRKPPTLKKKFLTQTTVPVKHTIQNKTVTCSQRTKFTQHMVHVFRWGAVLKFHVTWTNSWWFVIK